MATLTQLENFEAALAAIDNTLQIDTSMDNYIVLLVVAPTEILPKYALSDMLTKLAHAHGLHFDGYNELGYPCFINEEDEDMPS